ncbi:MAG: hypothetical protein KZQ77_12140 [Candidatus Thiodiazotropha sp. (ex Notomyrtea botanica)]|nr:hypothetical protein [Candidatus Thiodiazotropha sp. (ex Notomyrtea botanica)]
MSDQPNGGRSAITSELLILGQRRPVKDNGVHSRTISDRIRGWAFFFAGIPGQEF